MLQSMLDNSEKNARRNLFVFSVMVIMSWFFVIPTTDVFSKFIGFLSSSKEPIVIPTWKPYLVFLCLFMYLLWCFLRSSHAEQMRRGFYRLSGSSILLASVHISLKNKDFRYDFFRDTSLWSIIFSPKGDPKLVAEPTLCAFEIDPRALNHLTSHNAFAKFLGAFLCFGFFDGRDKFGVNTSFSINTRVMTQFLGRHNIDFNLTDSDELCDYMAKHFCNAWLSIYSEKEGCLSSDFFPLYYQIQNGELLTISSKSPRSFAYERSFRTVRLTCWYFLKLFFRSEFAAYFFPVVVASFLALLILAGRLFSALTGIQIPFL